MNITIASKLMELYAACPKCGCEVIGNGKGLLECDTAAGFFKRSCGCGWHVEVTEVIAEGSMPEDPPELPAEDEDEPEPVAFANPEPEPAPEPISEPEPVLEPEKIRPWNGFVHIRCAACHKESTTCLRTPTDTYICKECGHEMPLPKAYAGHGGSTFSAPHSCRLTMHKTPSQFCAARSLPESAAPLPGQSAAVKSLPISVPPPKHFLVVCSDSKRPCFRKPPDPYRNMWPLCLVFRRPQIDTIFRARFL